MPVLRILSMVLFSMAMAAAISPVPTRAEGEPVRLCAAGSLRAALTEVAAAFRAAPHGAEVALTFGASGLLRQWIEGGEAADVFASANLGHPQALAQARGLPYVLFARNRLCALARPGLEVTTGTLLARMLDPAVRLGTSTPQADPAGDYAWALFAKAEALHPGAQAALEAKALRLVGNPQAATPPPGETRSVYGWLIGSGAADLFLTYCTNAAVAAREVPGARVVNLPEALSVGAEYGLVVLSDRPAAARLALFVLSPDGQAILARHGFNAPLVPQQQNSR